MERVPNNTPEQSPDPLKELDARLLAAVPGQEPDVAEWMEQRRQAIQELSLSPFEVQVLEDIQQRTTRLEDKFLHWRRSFIMELSLIDQHLRFLSEQESTVAMATPIHLDIRA